MDQGVIGRSQVRLSERILLISHWFLLSHQIQTQNQTPSCFGVFAPTRWFCRLAASPPPHPPPPQKNTAVKIRWQHDWDEIKDVSAGFYPLTHTALT